MKYLTTWISGVWRWAFEEANPVPDCDFVSPAVVIDRLREDVNRLNAENSSLATELATAQSNAQFYRNQIEQSVKLLSQRQITNKRLREALDTALRDAKDMVDSLSFDLDEIDGKEPEAGPATSGI